MPTAVLTHVQASILHTRVSFLESCEFAMAYKTFRYISYYLVIMTQDRTSLQCVRDNKQQSVPPWQHSILNYKNNVSLKLHLKSHYVEQVVISQNTWHASFCLTLSMIWFTIHQKPINTPCYTKYGFNIAKKMQNKLII